MDAEEREAMSKLHDELIKMNACAEAVKWVGRKSLKTAWAKCRRADWMLWYAARTCDRKLVVLAACACVRTALKYVAVGELRPLKAIETAEAWARGKAPIKQVRDAARSAAYASVAYSSAAYRAAYSCACAASASYRAYSCACAASCAASCASSWYASASEDSENMRIKALSKMADIVRRIIPSIE